MDGRLLGIWVNGKRRGSSGKTKTVRKILSYLVSNFSFHKLDFITDNEFLAILDLNVCSFSHFLAQETIIRKI